MMVKNGQRRQVFFHGDEQAVGLNRAGQNQEQQTREETTHGKSLRQRERVIFNYIRRAGRRFGLNLSLVPVGDQKKHTRFSGLKHYYYGKRYLGESKRCRTFRQKSILGVQSRPVKAIKSCWTASSPLATRPPLHAWSSGMAVRSGVFVEGSCKTSMTRRTLIKPCF